MKHIVIAYTDDESFTIADGDGDVIISANHDEDGWHGMSKIRDAVEATAHYADITVYFEGEPNV